MGQNKYFMKYLDFPKPNKFGQSAYVLTTESEKLYYKNDLNFIVAVREDDEWSYMFFYNGIPHPTVQVGHGPVAGFYVYTEEDLGKIPSNEEISSFTHILNKHRLKQKIASIE